MVRHLIDFTKVATGGSRNQSDESYSETTDNEKHAPRHQKNPNQELDTLRNISQIHSFEFQLWASEKHQLIDADNNEKQKLWKHEVHISINDHSKTNIRSLTPPTIETKSYES